MFLDCDWPGVQKSLTTVQEPVTEPLKFQIGNESANFINILLRTIAIKFGWVFNEME